MRLVEYVLLAALVAVVAAAIAQVTGATFGAPLHAISDALSGVRR